MTERPIPFRDWEVLATLKGVKTQLRRVMKPAKVKKTSRGLIDDAAVNGLVCPYGDPGDMLWVRETFCAHWGVPPHDAPPHRLIMGDALPAIKQANNEYYQPVSSDIMTVWYGADNNKPWHIKWRPSIHMPRWASRITLEVKSVRVERLQDISEDDARAEGVGYKTPGYLPGTKGNWIGSFAYLWNYINGSGAWDANPWVWAISFERVKP